MRTRSSRLVIGLVLLLTMLGAPSLAMAAQDAQRQSGDANERVIVVARSDADYDALRADVQRAGGSIVSDIRSGIDLKNRLQD